MRASILALAVAMAVTPVLAQAAHKAAKADTAEPDHTGPVAYADLAAIDAKMNSAPTHKHMMKKKMKAAPAAAAAPADASATPSQ